MRWLCSFGIVALLSLPVPAGAVILSSSAARNTAAPTGALAPSGWDSQGLWRGFLGTPISKKYFITAGHIGGGVGENFQIAGRRFVTTAVWDDPNSDLRIYSVNKRFDTWAPLYTGTKELGKVGVLFGRGTQRGDVVTVNSQPAGWAWGIQDTVKSWGTNTIDTIINGDAGEGQLLQLDFDLTGTAQEGTLSTGDSAGGIFIYDKTDQRYKLAGLSFSVDGPFRLAPNSGDFQASLFNLQGVYYNGQRVNDAQPGRFFATRVSSNLSWINGVLNGLITPTASASATSGKGVPEPGTASLLIAAALLARRSRK